MTIAMAKWELLFLENKAELQLVETAILIGQFQSDRAFKCAIKKNLYPLYCLKNAIDLRFSILWLWDKLTDMLIDWQIQWIWSAVFKRLTGTGIQFKAY